MNVALQQVFSRNPFFLLLLPAFFVLHGLLENFGIVPVKDALLLILFYTGIGLLLASIAYLLFRHWQKAFLFSFLLSCIQFFFGSFHDWLKASFPGSFIQQYSFLLPFIAVSLVLFFLLLRRIKNTTRLFFFLNSLLLLLLCIDGLLVTTKVFTKKLPGKIAFTDCVSCEKPDVYLILADGYPGKVPLNDLFGYDNTAFEEALRNKGFHIVDSSRSNYNYTPFSVSSLLNMDYLEGIKGNNSNPGDIAVCASTIKQSNTLRFFEEQGYAINNYSVFDFKNQPSRINASFLLQKTKPILAQTFTGRIKKDLHYHLFTTFKIKSVIDDYTFGDRRGTEKAIRLTKETAALQTGTPKFVYSHLMIPHFPYYYDSSGRAFPLDTMLNAERNKNKDLFISYLQYSNRQLLALVDTILVHSAKPPVILLMSDHGFREFDTPVDARYHFMNLNAVFLPGKNYTAFYTGMTSINQFRVLFNTAFEQQIPLLKDSTSVLIE